MKYIYISQPWLHFMPFMLKCFPGTNLYTCAGGGDAFLLGLTKNQHWTGAWCDLPKDRKYPFICEGLI